jgi:putative Ca2+/H+ antiporter (TMEM165/GDT1 family)
VGLLTQSLHVLGKISNRGTNVAHLSMSVLVLVSGIYLSFRFSTKLIKTFVFPILVINASIMLLTVTRQLIKQILKIN